MRVKILLSLSLCLAASVAQANAGLTSAGVTPTTNQPAEEPTLAQVAPVAGTTNAVPGQAVAANAATNPGVANGAAGNAANVAPVAATRVAVPVPPPPPDPATLPVSVIRPLNKSTVDAAPERTVVPTKPVESNSSVVARAPREPREPTTTQAENAPPPRAPTVRPAPPATPRVETAARPIAESSPGEATPDAAASGVIFYTGSGLAGAIVLLSIGAFMRGRGEG